MIEKKIVKNKTIATRITEEQSNKLKQLAAKKDVSAAHLLSQLIEIGYCHVTRNKKF